MYKLYSLALKTFCLQIIFLFFVVYCILKVTWKPEKDTEAQDTKLHKQSCHLRE